MSTQAPGAHAPEPQRVGGGRVIHTGQVVIDLTMRVPELPEAGGDVFATESGTAVGGGFNVLAAASRFGAQAVYAGALGQGPLSEAARLALAEIGAEHAGASVAGDLGYCVAVTDDHAERTFLSTRGAETRNPLTAFDHLEPGHGDVLYITGYSLLHPANRAALERLVSRLCASCAGEAGAWPQRDGRGWQVLVDASPVIGEVAVSTLADIARVRPLWSVNEREARILCHRFGIEAAQRDGADPGEVARRLGAHLGAVLVRCGARGSWLWDGQRVLRTPSPVVDAIDTNGAGDAHAGVLAAALAQGEPVDLALRWANVAGALSTTQVGPATCPTRAQILAYAP